VSTASAPAAAEYRNVIGRFLTGVTVVTTRHADALHGITASSLASLSVEPPRLLVCLNRQSATRVAVAAAGRFVVNVLGSGQDALAMHFASRLPDKFSMLEHRLDAHGLPRLPGAIATLGCRVVREVDGGTHSIFIGEVEDTAHLPGAPLGYFRGRFVSVDAPG
jgi:flavin reductase (DIM6/NTAB) family NADH-FMN oxidoreductase RutF